MNQIQSCRRGGHPSPIARAKATLVSLSFLLVLAGCQSPGGSEGDHMASVTIRNRTSDQIRDAATVVFREQGYSTFTSGDDLVFQKAGSFGNTVARDGLVAAVAGGRTPIRVRLKIVDLLGDAYRVECDAFLVSSAYDPFFEDEHRLSNLRKGPYQKLLNKTAERLAR